MRARQGRGARGLLRSADERAIQRAAIAMHAGRERQRADELARSDFSARWAEWWVNLRPSMRRRLGTVSR